MSILSFWQVCRHSGGQHQDHNHKRSGCRSPRGWDGHNPTSPTASGPFRGSLGKTGAILISPHSANRILLSSENSGIYRSRFFLFPECSIVPSQRLTSCSICKHCDRGWWAGWLGVGFTSRVIFLSCKDSINRTRTAIYNSSKKWCSLSDNFNTFSCPSNYTIV